MNKFFYVAILCFTLFCACFSAHADDAALDSYKLGSGDTIQILVYDEEDLSLEARLGDSGILSYPFLGELKLSGIGVNQAEQLIIGGLKGDYLIDPKVSVSVVEYRQFYVNGEVERPGGFSFQPGLTVGKAISLAGGFTERASRRNINVLSAGAGEPERKVDLLDQIRPGDVITVNQSFF